MTYSRVTHTVEVLKVDDLPFPMLLGQDAPGFARLVRSALAHTTAVVEDDEQLGPSNLSEPTETLLFASWDTDEEFFRAEEIDPTLASI